MHTTATKRTPHTNDSHAGAEPSSPVVHASPEKLPMWAQTGFPIQTRLMINQPGDKYEQEADRMAKQVMRMPEPGVQRKICSCGKPAELDGMCDACKRKELGIQRLKSGNVPQTTAPPIVHQVLQQPGRPLDGATRNFMEARFGQDFSQVRVHTGKQASESAQAVNAWAYTVEQDIVFGTGQHAPGTTYGRRLLAHELAHVVQQGGGALQRAQTPAQGMVTQGNAPSERDAEKMGASGTHGMGMSVSGARADETVKHGLGQAEVTRRSAGVHGNLEKVPLNFLSIAHELPHAVQQQCEGTSDATAPPISRRSAEVSRDGPGTGGVHRVTMTCGGTIDFETDDGLLAYQLEEPCDMPVGDFEPTVTVNGDDVHFDFGTAEAESEGGSFDFRYRIDPGQPNPSILFNRSGDSVPFTVFPASSYGYSVQFNVRMLTPEEFIALTGLDANTLPENTPVPVSAAASVGGETPVPDIAAHALPIATGASGLMAISPISLVPSNSTGVLFSPGHVSFFANPGGSMTTRGFRASLFTHTMADLGPGAIGDSFAESLWRGTPGRFHNDWMFGGMAPQTVLYTPRDGEAAALFAEHLRGARYDETYRFSPPRPDTAPGTREFRIGERIYGSTRDPNVVLCTRNCITVPAAEWEAALDMRPILKTPEGPLDLITGEYASGEVDPYRAGRVRDLAEFTRSPEAHGPGGGVRVSSFTPAGARAFTAVKVGGTIMLIYGVVTTTERLVEAYDTPEFGAIVAEETGTWTGGILGSALGTAAAGAILCSPTGPVDLVCVAGGFVLGALGGLIFGTAGGMAGRAIYESSGSATGGSHSGTEYLGQGLYLDHSTGRAYLGLGPKF